MSSTPQETETHEVTLSREEQWVVHHVLSTRVDDALDDDESPPDWTLELVETIESGAETLTGYQARRLHDALGEYVDQDETPQQDVVHGSAVLTRLEEFLEAEH
ncbi:hypothetical protein ACFO5R_18075 [Halosolutus amylolyticus]|uniref:Uncharacterized protein n=1 Tax=Halosolutus amylolyticus TaxID=2932267 RepID=A0ABD5PTE1_9EURY|nr:hypothetical protein [Halosolutus amylolyticus]